MKSLGSLLLFLGAGSIVMDLIGREFFLIMWIDNWGETVGWVIRGSMIVAGGALMFLAPAEVQEEEAPEQTEAE